MSWLETFECYYYHYYYYYYYSFQTGSRFLRKLRPIKAIVGQNDPKWPNLTVNLKAHNTHEQQLGSWLNLCLWTLKPCKLCCDQEIRFLKIAKRANF